MDKNEILSRLAPIFEDTFVGDDYELSLATTQDDIEEWNSLNQVRLLLAIEADFGFKFDLAEMEDLDGVAELVDTISAKLAD